jgi:hypothetical protein
MPTLLRLAAGADVTRRVAKPPPGRERNRGVRRRNFALFAEKIGVNRFAPQPFG